MAGFHRKRRRSRRGEPSGSRKRSPGPAAQARRPDEPVPTPADLAAVQRERVREPPPAASTPAVADPDEEREPQPADREAERGLRGLVGSGASQVSVWAAARARDAARPTEEDLARAERELTIVRRNWVPREPFRPGGKRGERHGGDPGR